MRGGLVAVAINLAVLGGLTGGAVVLFAANIEPIVKSSITRHGSEITGAKVTLNGVDFAARSGRGSLTGLRIGNPSGYWSDYALRFGEITVELDIGTVTSNPVVIRRVEIAGLKAIYEVGTSGSNVDAIGRNITAYLRQHGITGRDGPTGRRFIIRNFHIRNTKVAISPKFLHGIKFTTPVPDIHLRNLGGNTSGITMGEISRAVIGTLGDRLYAPEQFSRARRPAGQR